MRFFENLTVLCPNPSLRRTKTIRSSSASVRFLEILTGPPSKSVLEADGKGSSASILEEDVFEEKLPSRVLHRPVYIRVDNQIRPEANVFDRKWILNFENMAGIVGRHSRVRHSRQAYYSAKALYSKSVGGQ